MIADITVREHRHLMFATTQQLAVLVNCKHWFIDATFRLVKEPYTQLFTINAFLRYGENCKQVPLYYVIMSGKSKLDYKGVFTALIDMLPAAPKVSTITADFEAAMWKATNDILPDVIMHGCVFHFTQAIWRRIQQLGLQVSYNKQSTFRPSLQL